MKLSQEQIGFMNLADSDILAMAARGEIDLNQIAKQKLAGRGQDKNGQWVGFEKAEEIHGLQ
jgi:hypothetical protein